MEHYKTYELKEYNSSWTLKGTVKLMNRKNKGAPGH